MGEVFDYTVPNNVLSRAELNYEFGTVKNIHYGDILVKYGAIINAQSDNIPFVTGKSSEEFKGAFLQDGDIVFADTAEDETAGKACEVVELKESCVVAGLHTWGCRTSKKMALGYFGYYLNSNAYRYQLLPLMQGIKVLSLSKSNMQKTIIQYPKEMDEQGQIANYLCKLDHLITLHQR